MFYGFRSSHISVPKSFDSDLHLGGTGLTLTAALELQASGAQKTKPQELIESITKRTKETHTFKKETKKENTGVWGRVGGGGGIEPESKRRE